VLQLLVTANVVPNSLILSIYLMFLRPVLRLLVIANIVPDSQMFFTLLMEAKRCSEMTVLRGATRRHIKEDIFNNNIVSLF
jgi:hypothetical protein